MKLLFLGTGTSTGVPQIGCNCPTCRSLDPCDHRLRASAIVSVGDTNILIDCGPDFRTQILRARQPHLDALLVTHIHYDHVGGIDDLRPYCKHGAFPLYCTQDVAQGLKHNFPYCFVEHPYPGVPSFDMNIIEPYKSFNVCGVNVVPLTVMHYKLPIVGYRIGNLAYITDCKTMPEATLKALKDVKVLVINALRHKEHMSHLNLSEAEALVSAIKPDRAYFTHMCHDIGLSADLQLPPGMQLAHDMMTIKIEE